MPSRDNPTVAMLVKLRNEAVANFNLEIRRLSTFDENKERVDELVAELMQIGLSGGSDRTYVEHKVVEMFQKFEDPTAHFGHEWPVEKFLREYVDANTNG